MKAKSTMLVCDLSCEDESTSLVFLGIFNGHLLLTATLKYIGRLTLMAVFPKVELHMIKVRQFIKKYVHVAIQYAVRTREVRSAILDSVNVPKSPVLRSVSNRPVPGKPTFEQQTVSARSDVVFISSRFRSGSTVLWNAFRQLDNVTSYYEPFNERRFFHKENRGDSVDSTHIGVSDYSKEYDKLEQLDDLYNEDWTRKNLFMDEFAWNPKMLDFIQTLVAATPNSPVMQFNRIDFRLPWIKEHFPNAHILHLWRDPREQWCSILLDPKSFPFDSPIEKFPDNFYLMQWVEDLKGVIPVFRDTENFHPYRLFYLVWKLSWLFGQQHASLSFSYESLVGDNKKTLLQIVETLKMDQSCIPEMSQVFGPPRENRWPQYADESWFAEHEYECEKLLDQYFR